MYAARTRAHLSRCVADAFLAGTWDERALLERLGSALDRRPPWAEAVAREVLAAYHRAPSDRPRELARFVDRRLERRPTDPERPEPPRIRRWLIAEPEMGRLRWPVPEIPTLGALGAFLGVSDGERGWFADARGLERTVLDERLRHYRYAGLSRPGRPVRVIERPKRRLKEIQRHILHEILDLIPAHDAAHGFTRGRSVRSHAQAHAGRFVVIRLDLEDFFASIAARRVYGLFRMAGYPEAVAHALTALSTNVVPAALWRSLPRPDDPAQIAAHHRLGRRLATPHLPQGAPTSPALANLATFTLDRRLGGLARSFDARYTRYADDLTFSGPARLVRSAAALRRAVAQIAHEEGFEINERKSTLTTRAGRQLVCGVVVNERPNVARQEFDALKALLHNSVVHGPASQNRTGSGDFRAHLLGRISWMDSLNPGRAAKLRREFSRIVWD